MNNLNLKNNISKIDNQNSISKIATQSIINIVIIIVLTIVIVWILYKIYQFYTNKTVYSKSYVKLLPESQNGRISRIIEAQNIPTNKFSNQYAISCWLRIDDFTYRFKKEKVVMVKGSRDGSDANPMISIDPHTNNIIIKVKVQTSDPVLVNGLGGDLSSGVYNDLLKVDGNYQDSKVEGFQNNIVIQNNINKFVSDVSDNTAPSCNITYDPKYFDGISGNIVPPLCNNNSNSNSNNLDIYTSGVTEGFQDDVDDNTDSGGVLVISQLDGMYSKMLAEVKMKNISINEYNRQMIFLVEGICNLLSWLAGERHNMSRAMVGAYHTFFSELLLMVQSNNMKNPDQISESDFKNNMNSQFDQNTMDSIVNMEGQYDMVVSILYLKKAEASNELDISRLNNDLFNEMKNKVQSMSCNIDIASGTGLNQLIEQMITKVKEELSNMLVEVAVELSDKHILKVEDPSYSTCIIKDFPLQRWTHLVVSVDNSTCDVYMDGELHSSCVFEGYPTPNNGDLYLSQDGGYDGGLANLIYVNGALNKDEVYGLYLDGPTENNGLYKTVSSWL